MRVKYGGGTSEYMSGSAVVDGGRKLTAGHGGFVVEELNLAGLMLSVRILENGNVTAAYI